MASELIQIIYDESQRASCYPFAKVYFNNELTIFFENSCIVELVSATQADKIAVCSWKLKEKLKWNVGYKVKPRQITENVLDSDYQVLAFTKNTRHHQMLAAADKWHPGFLKTMRRLCDIVGVKLPHEVKRPIYQNHFSAKTKIYQDYIVRYLKPAIVAIQNDGILNEMAMSDSNYSNLDRNAAKKRSELQEKIGIEYYPMAPFILERLFSIYVHNNQIQVTDL